MTHPDPTSTPNADKHTSAPAVKRPYEPPQLEPYGAVGALTAGPFGGISDTLAGGTGGFTQFSP